MLLILEVIFSWVNPHAPLAPFVRALNEPLLSPIRRVVPAIGGIDFTDAAAAFAAAVRIIKSSLSV
jgi:YggT family protein